MFVNCENNFNIKSEYKESDVDLELINSLNEKILDLSEKNQTLIDEKLRLQAENQNLIRRHQEDIKKTKDYAIQSFSKELISISDTMILLLNDKSNNFDVLKDAVNMNFVNFMKILSKFGVEKITVNIGDEFNPNQEEAVSIIKKEGFDKNKIVDILQDGFFLKDRVLRPAKVVVSS